MDPDYRPMIDFLRGLGTDNVPHSGDKAFLAHLVAVFRDLEAWGCERDVCRAGLFHSIYGTELFRRFALPLEHRGEVSALIGERAERLAFANCLMDRSSFDALLESDSEGPYCLRNRETGETIELSRETTTTWSACTCATGWSRSRAPAAGTTGPTRSAAWPGGWAAWRRSRTTACTPSLRRPAKRDQQRAGQKRESHS